MKCTSHNQNIWLWPAHIPTLWMNTPKLLYSFDSRGHQRDYIDGSTNMIHNWTSKANLLLSLHLTCAVVSAGRGVDWIFYIILLEIVVYHASIFIENRITIVVRRHKHRTSKSTNNLRLRMDLYLTLQQKLDRTIHNHSYSVLWINSPIPIDDGCSMWEYFWTSRSFIC